MILGALSGKPCYIKLWRTGGTVGVKVIVSLSDIWSLQGLCG